MPGWSVVESGSNPMTLLQVEMSSQQFPRLGTPSTGLSQAPSQIASSASAGLISPAATGELGGLCLKMSQWFLGSECVLVY